VSKSILLDTSVLGEVTHPKANREIALWLKTQLSQGSRVCVPEIADYELRRELIRAGKTTSVERLDAFIEHVEYLPISTAIMRTAAKLWARARNEGVPTADDQALDGDVILAAQAVHYADLTPDKDRPIVATSNVGHLGRFVLARNWDEID
jgi:predicted nucleic acid-binding protein